MQTQMQRLKTATEQIDHAEMARRITMLHRINKDRQVVPLHMWCDNCDGKGGWFTEPRWLWVQCDCQKVND